MSEAVERLKTIGDEVRRLYWKEKNLPGALRAAREGIDHGEAAAAQEPDRAEEILGLVKGLFYDTASFSWVGWDEPGITPTDEEGARGYEAARKNLDYAIQLKKPDLPRGRAHWMLASHALTAGNHDEALEHYREATKFARSAGADGEAELGRGFEMLTQVKQGVVDPSTLQTHVEAMNADEQTKPFTSQISACAKVIGVVL